jgi:WD40 repeat protein
VLVPTLFMQPVIGGAMEPITVQNANNLIEKACGDQHSRAVYSVAWSPDGAMLASGSDDCTIQLMDTTT